MHKRWATGDYKDLIELPEAAGYQRAAPDMQWFQLRRTVELNGQTHTFH